jgi:DNA-binding transcriptional LysR family regulator
MSARGRIGQAAPATLFAWIPSTDPSHEALPMDLRQLSHFVAVAEDGSFTRAAQRMHIVQSGISASIAALERELGVPVFRRSKHRIDLTAAGRALLVEARRALAAVAAGKAAALAANAALHGRLTIGIARAIPEGVQFPRLVHQFHVANPDVDLYLSELAGNGLDELRAGQIDLVLGPGQASGVTSIPLAKLPIMLACAKTHPLAGRRSVRMSDLAGEHFIDVPERWASRTLADRALADAGIERRSIIEVSNVQLALRLVAEQTGVALLPDISADYAVRPVFVPIRPSIGTWELSVSFLGEEPATPAARAFLASLLSGPTEHRAAYRLDD